MFRRFLISLGACAAMAVPSMTSAQTPCDNKSWGQNRDTINCDYHPIYGWIVRGSAPPVPSQSNRPQPSPLPSPSLPPISLNIDVNYDPGSAYRRSLDVPPPAGVSIIGAWHVAVGHDSRGHFQLASMTTQATMGESRQIVTVSVSCDFGRAGRGSGLPPDLDVVIEHGPVSLRENATPVRVVLAKPVQWSDTIYGLGAWDIDAKEARAKPTPIGLAVGEALRFQFEQSRASLALWYGNGRVVRGELSTDRWREAYARLAPCWTQTDFWKREFTALQQRPGASSTGGTVQPSASPKDSASRGSPGGSPAVDRPSTGAESARLVSQADWALYVAKNEPEAARLYRLAADQGVAHAHAALAIMHMLGQGGLAKDETEAARRFQIAAGQGDARARTFLAAMYFQGRGGLAKNDVEAERLFRLAANQGYPLGQLELGRMYEWGRGGLAKDPGEAIKWYRAAAAQGNRDAQTALARLGIEPQR